jgi:type IV fimbrial biogenesis protein FimT
MIIARESGFTMVELMITLVVVAILLAAAVPFLGDFTRNNRLVGQSNDIASSIQLARSEAVKQGVNTVICPSSDLTSCSNNAADWQNGWLVFSDFNLDGDLDAGASAPLCEATEDCLMKTGTGIDYKNTLTTTATLLRFLPTGLASNGGTVTFRLVSDKCHIDQARDIKITIQGHTLVSTVACP